MLPLFTVVICTHPFAKEALTFHLARGEGHKRYFDCNLMHCKVLASSHQHLMAEAPTDWRARTPMPRHLWSETSRRAGLEFVCIFGHDGDSGGGRTDVWKRHHFAWEYKGQRADLDTAFGQPRLYREVKILMRLPVGKVQTADPMGVRIF